jgi:hypothetical protein
MGRFFDILSALSKSRTVVYPAVIGFVTAGVHMIGMSHDVERKVLHFVDASFGLLGAGVFVWGVMADMQNAKTKQAIDSSAQQTSVALTKQANTINTINPAVETSDATAPPIQTPVEINPQEKQA